MAHQQTVAMDMEEEEKGEYQLVVIFLVVIQPLLQAEGLTGWLVVVVVQR